MTAPSGAVRRSKLALIRINAVRPPIVDSAKRGQSLEWLNIVKLRFPTVVAQLLMPLADEQAHRLIDRESAREFARLFTTDKPMLRSFREQ